MSQDTGFIRAGSANVAEADLIDTTTGDGYVGTVTVYVTIDRGTQTLATENGGLATSKGNGLYHYYPSAAESDGTVCTFTFTGAGTSPRSPQYWTIRAGQSSALAAASTPGVMAVSDLISSALKRIGAVGATGEVSAEDSQEALNTLNAFIELQALDGLFVPYTKRTTWTISSTKGILGNPYTVGTGGDIDVLRPALPNSIKVRYQDTSVSPTQEYKLDPLTDDAWSLIPMKGLTSPLPTSYYYEPTYASGFGSLYLWMIPTSTTLQGVLYAPSQIVTFGAVSDSVVLPQGYFHMLRDNLALILATTFDYGVTPDALLVESARKSLAMIRRANIRQLDMSVDPAMTPNGSRYNIYSDTSS